MFRHFYHFFRDSYLIEDTLKFFYTYLMAPNISTTFVDEMIKNLKEAKENHDQKI